MEKKNLVMITLCVAIGIMAIAYAAFSTTLTVDGTINATGDFAVIFTEDTVTCTPTITKDAANAPSGTVTKTTDATITATLSVSLQTPGDEVTCVIPIKNDGNLKARLAAEPAISNNLNSSTQPISVTASATSQLAADATGNITVVVKYNWTDETQPATTSATFTVTADYEQDIQ